MDRQESNGYAITAIAILILLWLLRNGNSLLHGNVSATVNGVPVGSPDFYAGADAPPSKVGASGCVGCGQ